MLIWLHRLQKKAVQKALLNLRWSCQAAAAVPPADRYPDARLLEVCPLDQR